MIPYALLSHSKKRPVINSPVSDLFTVKIPENFEDHSQKLTPLQKNKKEDIQIKTNILK